MVPSTHPESIVTVLPMRYDHVRVSDDVATEQLKGADAFALLSVFNLPYPTSSLRPALPSLSALITAVSRQPPVIRRLEKGEIRTISGRTNTVPKEQPLLLVVLLTWWVFRLIASQQPTSIPSSL